MFQTGKLKKRIKNVSFGIERRKEKKNEENI